MIIGIGVDVCDISRIEKLISKKTAIKKMFTKKEQDILSTQTNKAQWAAGRFAAKEAASKALKAGIAKCPIDCVEVLYDKSGAPCLTLHGVADALLCGTPYTTHVSITHDAGIAMAVVVIENAVKSTHFKDEKQAQMIANLLPTRKLSAHKGDMGSVAVFAGSKKYSGAGYLATLGALKGGAGLVTWCRKYKADKTPPEAMDYVLPKINPVSAFAKLCNTQDVAVIGPGLGKTLTCRIMHKILRKIKCSMVLDADALNAISKMKTLPKLSHNTIITPHIGEAARLLKKDNAYVSKNIALCAKSLAEKTGAVVVLKSHSTVVCAPNGDTFINTTGNAGMATGGSGDVLAGLIGALLKRLSPFDAARYGVYLHGLAGDIAQKKIGENAMTAIDIVDRISDAFLALEDFLI